MKRICKQCGREFELTDSGMDFYRRKQLEYPKRCKSCRELNRIIGMMIMVCSIFRPAILTNTIIWICPEMKHLGVMRFIM
ncbi:MAG: zinc-ribbon domain containing protein [Lachnospiraceae bacterium]|nr:zinc-ribbon domain containing protein [Lachnospiraceae bacterium]